ncbi:hypothetical protein [Pelagibacterium montanilacus]|uniref:hypothetical protein n=1 Tax=Pelagibacterium montanilacus TaxID=2185280 RepID=UPI000F8ED521|nr:hypothetical protein [Pelagibacterium montanilacus]
MRASTLIRQSHRWLSIVFVLAVLAATAAAATGQDTDSLLYYLPLPPLFVLMASGLYLFVLPYAARRRRG